MYKVNVVTAVAMVIPLVAFAGKQERDVMTKQVMPAVKEAEAKYKSACGCSLAITVDEATVKSIDDLHGVRFIAQQVSEGVAKYCSDDASKKAMCQLKSLTLSKSKPAGFTFKDGKGVATTDGQMNCSFGQITHVLDK
jgi:hypothetical protein